MGFTGSSCILLLLSQPFLHPFLRVSPSFLSFRFLRKEVIQPQVLLRLPCYDFTPVIGFALGKLFLSNFGHPQLPWCDGRCVQDPGTHSPRHSDSRLLATPTSCRRVAAYNPNWDWLWSFALYHYIASLCTNHCSTCVAQDIKGMMI